MMLFTCWKLLLGRLFCDVGHSVVTERLSRNITRLRIYGRNSFICSQWARRRLPFQWFSRLGIVRGLGKNNRGFLMISGCVVWWNLLWLFNWRWTIWGLPCQLSLIFLLIQVHRLFILVERNWILMMIGYILLDFIALLPLKLTQQHFVCLMQITHNQILVLFQGFVVESKRLDLGNGKISRGLWLTWTPLFVCLNHLIWLCVRRMAHKLAILWLNKFSIGLSLGRFGSIRFLGCWIFGSRMLVAYLGWVVISPGPFWIFEFNLTSWTNLRRNARSYRVSCLWNRLLITMSRFRIRLEIFHNRRRWLPNALFVRMTSCLGFFENHARI